ncbi:unnamed protein product [Adineta steineri]|uniref:carbonic anhydrase n=2 Tax=Adineta steineri TaxID=433720 RepID=A0A815SFP5_9BILA|nr:unnamed protein product [Adineta steineri]CAF3533288.1 unnamed protein product [Adineta steineri]
MLQFVLTILLIVPITIESAGQWSYDSIKTWGRGNRYCAGHSQSPIDLRYNVSTYDNRLKKIVLEEQRTWETPEFLNNGHTVQLDLKKRYVLKNLAPGSEEYSVEQLHFHWGHSTDNINGSEHLFEGQSYPLEMHIVTYSKWYENIRDAMTNTRALAVVGVFFELTEQPNPSFQPLIESLAKIQNEGYQAEVSDLFDLKELLGDKRMERYYRYDGSLTTPPCYESVLWTVLVDPLKISLDQLNAFRGLHDFKTKLMANTYRPVRPLGTRKLFRSFPTEDIQEGIKLRMTTELNNGQNLKNNMQLIAILTCLLMVVVL